MQQMQVLRPAMSHLIPDRGGPIGAPNGTKYIVTSICELSSFVVARAMRNHTASTDRPVFSIRRVPKGKAIGAPNS